VDKDLDSALLRWFGRQFVSHLLTFPTATSWLVRLELEASDKQFVDRRGQPRPRQEKHEIQSKAGKEAWWILDLEIVLVTGECDAG